MGAMNEIIDAPLTREELAERYRELIDNPLYENLPGKVEIDIWGRIQLRPANNQHSMLQGELLVRLGTLGGKRFAEASILTPLGLLVADVAWASPEFMARHGLETPFTAAPELCIEIVSRSNTRKALADRITAFLEVGATEGWLVFPVAQRIEVYDRSGRIGLSRFEIDLAGLFSPT